MADLSKLKSRRTLGSPPPLSEASSNLDAPEIAPPPLPSAMPPAAPSLPESVPTPAVAGLTGQGRRVRDGRSARRTGRTVQFATRVTEAFDDQFRAIAERDGLLHVELLEKALAAYESVQSKR
jgi:hypothetical protein